MTVKFSVRIASPETERKFLNGKTLQSLPALPAYLVNFCGGREATNPSPWGDSLQLYDSESVKNKAVIPRISSFEQAPRLREYEFTRLEKFGPQGWIYPLGSDEMISKINAYYEVSDRQARVSDATKAAFILWLEEADLTPYTPDAVIQRALEKTGLVSNSGTPAFGKRKNHIQDTLSLLETVVAYQASGIPVDYLPASIIGARSIKQKMRLIFMAPFAQNVSELSYVYALMDWLLDQSDSVSGWLGQPAVEYAMQCQFSGRVTHLSTDFTAMDTTVGPAQVGLFSNVFQHAFKPQFREGFRNALRMVPYIPVIVGVLKSPGIANVSRSHQSLVYLEGTHGLFSGLGWTNLIETGLSLLLDQEFRHQYSVIATQVNGDDGEKTIDGRKNMDKVAETFALLARRMGFTCNPSKQLVSYDEIRYLQRVYSPETEVNSITHGAYPFVLTMNSIKNPERSANLSVWQQAERVINISNNLVGHPYCLDCIETIVSGSPAIQSWLMTGEGEAEMSTAFATSMSTGTLEGSNFAGEEAFRDVPIVQFMRSHADEILSHPGVVNNG